MDPVLAGPPGLCARLCDARRRPARLDPRVDRLFGQNAISGETHSALSSQILLRLGPTLYDEDPRAALEKVRAGLGGPDRYERLLALAELWFETALKSDDRGEYLAAAVSAYAYVFPETPPAIPPSPYDSRTHLVLEIYNRGIAKGLALAESSLGTEIDPSPRQIQMPFGTFVLGAPKGEFEYGGYRIVHPVALGDLELRGLRNRYRRPGAGVALAAGIEAAKGNDADPWLPPASKVPVTGFVRLDELSPDLARAHGTIAFYDAGVTGAIAVGSATVPLASDPSAALCVSPGRRADLGLRARGLPALGSPEDRRSLTHWTRLSQPLSPGPDPGRVRPWNPVEPRALGRDGERAAR